MTERYELPYGYAYTIEEVDEARMREEAECEPGDDTPDGLWDCEVRTVFVKARLRKRRRRYVVSHELIHVIADYQHFLLDEGAAAP